MTKFIGKKAGDVLVEYYGPIDGRNYNTAGDATPVAPAIDVQVFGTGSVQVQQNNVRFNQGNAGLNQFTYDSIGDLTSWVNLGPVIDSTSGIVTVVPTVDPKFSSIRVNLVTTGTGDGKVIVQSIWN